MLIKVDNQDMKKVLSGYPWQVLDFPARQVAFILTCLMGKLPGKSSAN